MEDDREEMTVPKVPTRISLYDCKNDPRIFHRVLLPPALLRSIAARTCFLWDGVIATGPAKINGPGIIEQETGENDV